MHIKKFMTKVLNYTYNTKTKTFNDDGGKFCMNKVLPCPPELKKVTSPVRAENGETEKEFEARVKRHKEMYGSEDWYDWQCNNWGTKWDAFDIDFDIDIENNDVSYNFNTAWSPITHFLQNIATKYPLLTFELYYEEPGAGFCGDFEVEGGEITNDDEREFVDRRCCSCGEDCEEGEELNEYGDCPTCAGDNEEEDED
jgi:hypothetical protein